MIFKSKRGTFKIVGDINDVLAYNIVKQILEFSEQYPSETVTLHIQSASGGVTAGMAIYDAIMYIPNEVITIAKGRIGGIATLILSSGTPGKRYAYKKAKIELGHFWIKQTEQPIPHEVHSAVQKVYKELSKHTNLAAQDVIDMIDSEMILNVDTAVQDGFIDHVKRIFD